MKRIKQKISFVIVTHKLESLEELINQAILLSDEIIIVRTGQKIKPDFLVNRKIKIYDYRLFGNFALLRNYAISKATKKWVLTIDSDEILSNEFSRKIDKLLGVTDICGYWFRRKYYIKSNIFLKHGLFYPDFQLRLFRNHQGYQYIGAVHEQLDIPKKLTKEIKIDIIHKQNPIKLGSFNNFYLLFPYIYFQSIQLRSKTVLYLILESLSSFFNLFFGGFFRGKGFLDGWPGFRAHLMFAASISLSYIFALLPLSWVKKYESTR